MTTLIAYRVAPNTEHRAAGELRQAGIRAYVPRDRTRKRSPFTGKHPSPAPGYVFAETAYCPAFEKHVKGRIGIVRKDDLSRLYLAKPAIPPAPPRLALGDAVVITQGPFQSRTGTIIEDRGHTYRVDIAQAGKISSVALHENLIARFIKDG